MGGLTLSQEFMEGVEMREGEGMGGEEGEENVIGM